MAERQNEDVSEKKKEIKDDLINNKFSIVFIYYSSKLLLLKAAIKVQIRDGGLEDRTRSRGRPRDLILMASVSVLVSAARVSVSVLASEVPALSTGSREPASVSRPASRPNLDGLGLGHPCLGLGLGGPSLDYNPELNHPFIHPFIQI